MPLLYQGVELEIDFSNDTVDAHTVLLLSHVGSDLEQDFVRLHCRQLCIRKVSINNIETSYTHLDALENLGLGSISNGEEIDIHYRSAVEIANRGELKLDIPGLYCREREDNASSEGHEDNDGMSVASESAQGLNGAEIDEHNMGIVSPLEKKNDNGLSVESVSTAPVTTPQIEKNEDKVYKDIDFLPSLPSHPGFSKSVTRKWAELDLMIKNALEEGGRILKIDIWYSVSNPTAGIVFRKARHGTDESSNSRSTTQDLKSFLAKSSIGLHCAYGAGGGAGACGGLFNVDGVRCWLPCIDSPRERAVFDCRIKCAIPKKLSDITPGMSDFDTNMKIRNAYMRWLSELSVLCSGVFIPPAMESREPFGMFEYRYITLNPIPACSLGLFIGELQTYRSPIYGSTGFICTQLPESYLLDLLNDSDNDVEVLDAEESQALFRRLLMQPLKDARFFESEVVAKPKASTHFNSNLPGQLETAFLGFEQGTRYLQRSIGKRYLHRQYVQIIMSEVEGCASTWGDGTLGNQFLSFDGFSILQQHAICTSTNMPFLESANHIQIINGFLTSWVTSSIVINSYDEEFIVTGCIGYLLSDYIQYIYSEDDRKIYFSKLYELIVHLECQGIDQGVPLVHSNSSIPPGFEISGLSFSELCRAKSIVFMHLIDHRLGRNSDVIKSKVIKLMMAMSPDFSKGNANVKLPKALANQINATGSVFAPESPVLSHMSPSPYHQPRSDLMPPPSLNRGSSNSSATGGIIFPPESPQMAATRLSQPPATASNVSIFPPPSPQASPHPQLRYAENPPMLAVMPPPVLSRGSSVQQVVSEPIEIKTYVPITPSVLLDLCRSAAGGAVSDLELDFLERYLYTGGIVLMRIGAWLDEKAKKLECVVQQIGFSNGIVEMEKSDRKKHNGPHLPYMYNKLDLHVVISGEVWKYSRALENYTQPLTVPIYNQPRRVGRRRKLVVLEASAASRAKLDNILDLADDDAVDLLTGENRTLGVGIEETLTSLQKVRGTQYNKAANVSFISIDPSVLYVRNISMASVPLEMTIEQLFTDTDIIEQLSAIRRLAMPLPVADSKENTALRLCAMTDCLKELVVPTDATVEDTVKHHVYVRANAAFALAKYQNLHAPRTSTTDTGGSWLAMKALVSIYMHYYFEYHPEDSLFVGGRGPSAVNLENIESTYLRSSILLALSSIKARSGITPVEILDLLLTQAENVYAVPVVNSGSNSKTDDQNLPFDESHFSSIVLLALSRMKISINTHGGDCYRIFKRMKDIVSFYLERDLVLSVAAREQDELSSKSSKIKSKRITTSAGGILTATAIQCMCEIECQIHPVVIRRPPKNLLVLRNKIDVVAYDSSGFAGSVSDGEFSFDYYQYLDFEKYSPLVRSAAVESIMKLFIYSIADSSAMKLDDLKPKKEAGPHGKELSSYTAMPSDFLNLVLNIISSDPDVSVRRNTAQALQSLLQGINPLRMSYCAISLGNLFETLEWFDSSGFSSIVSSQSLNVFGEFSHSTLPGNKHFSEYHLNKDTFNTVKHFSSDHSPSMQLSVRRFRSLLTEARVVSFDQVTRSHLLRAWLVLFGSDTPEVLRNIEENSKDSFLDLSHFSYLHPGRLSIANPVHNMKLVQKLLTWGDALSKLPEKAFSSNVLNLGLHRTQNKPVATAAHSNVHQSSNSSGVHHQAPSNGGVSAKHGSNTGTAGIASISAPRSAEPSVRIRLSTSGSSNRAGIASSASTPALAVASGTKKRPRDDRDSSDSAKTSGNLMKKPTIRISASSSRLGGV